MARPRLVPVLLTARDGLVKTRRFADRVYLGDPLNIIRIFNEKEVDELALLDIEVSAQSAGPNFSLVEEVASECFMPLAYGGGVRHVEDARTLFRIGVEKVVLRSAAARNPEVVSAVVAQGGSQSVAVAVDVARDRLGRLRVHAPGTPLHRSSDWEGFVRAGVQAGAGEVILTAVDRDGMMNGMDVALIKRAAGLVPTQLMAVGGVGSLEHIRAGLDAGATAVGAGAFFVFNGPRRAVLVSYPTAEEVSSLGGGSR